MIDCKNPSVAPGIYLHFKGHMYLVIGVAIHTETEEELVLYTEVPVTSGGRIWARPVSKWNEPVEDGTPRFICIKEV